MPRRAETAARPCIAGRLFGEAPTGLWFPPSQNLSVLLDSDRIIAYPRPVDKRPRYRFEVNSAREAQLAARWSVIDQNGKEAFNLKESLLAQPAKEKSTDGSVAALSETVADLSREIAKTVIAIDRQDVSQVFI